MDPLEDIGVATNLHVSHLVHSGGMLILHRFPHMTRSGILHVPSDKMII